MVAAKGIGLNIRWRQTPVTVLLVRPRRFADGRGWFSESWNRARFEGWGITADFCQDNHSLSRESGTLRGIHFQTPPFAQAKLVRCVRGRILDVAVDLRAASPTYGQWLAAELCAEFGDILFIPAGYGHGFVTVEADSEVIYKVDAPYAPEADGGIIWNDPDLAVDWRLEGQTPSLSDKDAHLPRLADLALDFPYDGRPLLPLNRIDQ
jgi:dTDP-4-dehydrorhamnose 3,5-epimerase